MRNLHRGIRSEATQPQRRAHNIKNLHRETPEHQESTQRGTRTSGIYTERHQHMKNLQREPPEHEESTHSMRNLHIEAPEHEECIQRGART